MFAFGHFLLLPAQRTLLANGQPVRLGSRGLDILIALVERAGEVVSKEELMARVWPRTVVDEGGLRVHIAGLRKTLGEVRSGQRYIGNVPSRGYCFVAPVSRSEHASGVNAPAAAPAATQLPSLLTRLIGRDDTIAALVEMVPRRRFVSLVGPGGIGKTTVALAAAAQLEAGYAQGVYFVDLAALTDAALVPGTVAAVLGVPSHSDDPVQDLTAWLSLKSVLLVLDNCEHVVAAAADLAESILGRTTATHLLATSREPLRAQGEWVQRLPALSAPPAGADCSFAEALNFAAFELFIERAAASFDGAALNDADVPQIAHLCHKLDGIPLAIELVAAQIGFYGLGGLVAMLEDRLSLTMLGRRTALPRHQTLRNTLDWSYQLLSDAEQQVLRRLSVFRERFTLKSAMAVAGERAFDISHVLMNLASKSLIAADPGNNDEAHYRLLETTRSYAAEQLAGTGEHQAVLRRHASYCVAAVQQATLEFEGRVPDRWRERHCRKIDDVRAALAWAFSEGGDFELGAKLAAESAVLYFGLWLVREYMQWLERALDRLPPHAADGVLDMQLSLEYGQASLAMRGGALEGLNALKKSAGIAERISEKGYQLSARWGTFCCHLLRGEYQAALRETELFGSVVRESNDTRAGFAFHRMMALCLHFLGDQAAALTHARESLRPSSVSIGQLHSNTYQLDHRTASLTQLARILWLQGLAEQAAQAAKDAIDAANVADHALSISYALTYAACPIALWSGDDALAARYVAELQACTDAHSLVFWQSWPSLYAQVLARRRDPSNAGALKMPTHVSQIDMLATLHPDFVGDEAIARAQSGASEWCAPEVLRVMAERSTGDAEAAERLLREALTRAQKQDAHAWSLRCATSLAKLLQHRRGEEARELLARALATCNEDTFDAREATHLLAMVSTRTMAAP